MLLNERSARKPFMATRRQLLFDGLKTVCAVEFMRVCIATKAYSASIAPNIEQWRAELEAIARDFRSDSLALAQWHSAIEELNDRVPMEDLLKAVAFDEVQPRLLALGKGEFFEKLFLPSVSEVGRPFSMAIFSVTPGADIPPHAHNNQVTAHMLVRGQLHTRTFQRLHDDVGKIIVKPNRDELLGVGTTVTMSPDFENVHWFTAQKEQVFSFQISASTPRSLSRHHVNREEQGGRVYLDLRGKPERDGTIVARVVDAAEGHRLYGA